MKTLLALFALFASSALIGAMLSACGYVPPTYGCTYTADKVISCTPFFNMPVTTPVNGIHYVQASDPEAAWFHTVDDLTFEGYIHIIGNANKCNYIGDRAHMIPTMTMGIDASIYAADGGASDAGEADAGPVFCNGDAGRLRPHREERHLRSVHPRQVRVLLEHLPGAAGRPGRLRRCGACTGRFF